MAHEDRVRDDDGVWHLAHPVLARWLTDLAAR